MSFLSRGLDGVRNMQGNGVFAISSACHGRRRIAGSRWTLRVVCLGKFVNVGATQVCHLYFGAAFSDISAESEMETVIVPMKD